MLLGPSALGGVEIAGLELPGGNGGPGANLRGDQNALNAVTALWGYANWGGARWAWPFFPPSGFIFVDWSGGFITGDGGMSGGMIG